MEPKSLDTSESTIEGSKQNDAPIGLDAELDSAADEKTITLVSSDGKEFTLTVKAAKLSCLLNTIIEHDSAADRIDIHNVESEVLEDIVKYLTYRNGKAYSKPLPTPLPSNNIYKYMEKADADFLHNRNPPMTPSKVAQIINGANYMDISSLIKLCSAYITAHMIKSKNSGREKPLIVKDCNDMFTNNTFTTLIFD